MRRAFLNPHHNTSSTVGLGVSVPLACSKPLYEAPRYANLSAMCRVEYLEGLKGVELRSRREDLVVGEEGLGEEGIWLREGW